jgi:hypothetical protein
VRTESSDSEILEVAAAMIAPVSVKMWSFKHSADRSRASGANVGKPVVLAHWRQPAMVSSSDRSTAALESTSVGRPPLNTK